ncbi:hypothetical protein BS47DRAFT_1425664 [Hydnum rufescens UP504]|uniref:Alkyl transferase n=1 Tax=Hydnum rufescens UP504 TaxID=1448309 RepID=A0A9P6AJU8_9AGAM|nr:hypothetical protein BS47DRAFT_1425664 [Hydnum rufescens UP504]
MDFCTRTFLSILKAGPIPRHIAFVMDGNRRYARKRYSPVRAGHKAGFQTLKKVLELCLNLDVKCVTVYSFSIENFKRSKEEVDAIMELAKDGLLELCRHDHLLAKYGVRLKIIGRKNLLPPDLQEIIRTSEQLTQNNHRALLNVCMPYTARDEIASSVQATIELHQNGDIPFDENEIAAHLGTALSGSPRLDMMIRTSGVKRLSDFLLWQTCVDTQIYFTPTYWPDFGLWEFGKIILDYQRKVWSESGKPCAVTAGRC